MAARLLVNRLRSQILRSPAASFIHHPPPPPLSRPLSTAAPRKFPKRAAGKPAVDIGARVRKMQTERLWRYTIGFASVASLVVLLINQFQDQLVFYVTPTEILNQFLENPSTNKFRLGGLVLEGSIVNPDNTRPEIEFIVTDLITDILVKFQGNVPDLFREGHSVVAEGFVKPMTDEIREIGMSSVSEKARASQCYLVATEVLAKHDEKYMPKEVAAALARNRKILEAKALAEAEPEAVAVAATESS